MMASSAAWSTSETKSFWRLRRTVSLSRSEEARVMMLPALRAAFTAVLSMGCMAQFYYGPQRHPRAHLRRALPSEPSGQHRGGGARDEDHGIRRPAPGRAEALSRRRGDRARLGRSRRARARA